MKAKYLLLFLILGLSFIFTGCEQIKELDQRLIVQGVGIDYKNEIYEVTLHLLDLENVKNDDVNTQNKVLAISAQGKNIMDAINNIEMQTGKKAMFSQNILLILGCDTAKNGVLPCLDFFVRHYEARPSVNVLIAKTSAKKIMQAKQSEKIISCNKILDIAKNSFSSFPNFRSDICTFINSIGYAGSIELAGDTEEKANQTEKIISAKTIAIELEEDGENSKIISGELAIFKNEKLIDFLDKEEAKNALLICSNAKNLESFIKLSNQDKISYKIMESKSQIIPQTEQIPTFLIDIQLNANIYEMESENQQIINSQDLEQKISQDLSDKINKIIQKCLNKGSEIFGFAASLRNQNSALFKENQKSIIPFLQNAKKQIEIQTKIKRLGKKS